MTTARIVNCSPYGMECTVCDELVIAPPWSEYVSKHEVRHFWFCENCGHDIETVINLGKSCELSRPNR
jgi:hypothetical protein